MTKRVNLGSVSHGTMRPEDLIPTFVDELEAVTGGCPLVVEIRERMEAEDYYDGEDVHEDMEALFDALGNYAPAYCYFGAHEGDGSDYGFWVSWDSLEEADDVVKVSDLSEVDELDGHEGYEYVLLVNDHGNATLYTAALEEVWAVV